MIDQPAHDAAQGDTATFTFATSNAVSGVTVMATDDNGSTATNQVTVELCAPADAGCG